MNTDAPIVGQVAPLNPPFAVDHEHPRPRNVSPVDGPFLVPETVRINRLQIRIRQNRKIQFQLPSHFGVLFDRIDTDRHHLTVGLANVRYA